MSLRLLKWDTVKNRLAMGSTFDYRAGTTAISNAATSVVVTFSSAIADLNYTPTAHFMNTTDSSPQYQPVTITNFTVNGFTASWNAAVDSANYKLVWNCLSNN